VTCKIKKIQDNHITFLKSFCDVGNTFSLGEVNPGNNVLDIGSGAEFDLCVAKRLVGMSGEVCGIDLIQEMIELTRKNLTDSNISDIEITHISSEEIPYTTNTLETVISNGFINLSPYKKKLFQEIFRVLKNGGRLQLADVVLGKELPGTLAYSLKAWSQ
jgi:ubiquinone/menaquinone biosynthesis C-methylase UbiE